MALSTFRPPILQRQAPLASEGLRLRAPDYNVAPDLRAFAAIAAISKLTRFFGQRCTL